MVATEEGHLRGNILFRYAGPQGKPLNHHSDILFSVGTEVIGMVGKNLPERLDALRILAQGLQAVARHDEVDQLIFELITERAQIEEKMGIERLPGVFELVKDEHQLYAMLLTEAFA